MKKLYIASARAFSGKTAITLGIGLYARTQKLRVGYLKPLQIQGYLPKSLKHNDTQDAEFVQRVFGLQQYQLETIAPIRIDDATLYRWLEGQIDSQTHWQQIEAAYQEISADKDLMLIEGSGTLRDGFACGINILTVTDHFDLQVLLITNWRGLVLTTDDVLASQAVIGDRMIGVVINSVPTDEIDAVKERLIPFLEAKHIAVYGVLPLQSQLRAISIKELAILLNATLHVGAKFGGRLIESLSVGAMSVESAVPLLRIPDNSAVITGADRVDLQGAALETSSVVALILTGDKEPTTNILQRAEEVGIAVLSVKEETIRVVENIEQVFGKTPMGQAEKLNRFQAILAQHFNYESLFKNLEGMST